jgi:hypothetical protein
MNDDPEPDEELWRGCGHHYDGADESKACQDAMCACAPSPSGPRSVQRSAVTARHLFSTSSATPSAGPRAPGSLPGARPQRGRHSGRSENRRRKTCECRHPPRDAFAQRRSTRPGWSQRHHHGATSPTGISHRARVPAWSNAPQPQARADQRPNPNGRTPRRTRTSTYTPADAGQQPSPKASLQRFEDTRRMSSPTRTRRP